MKTSPFTVVADAFQSVAFSVASANAADLAYHTGVGNPSGHVPFTAEDNPQMVAMNIVGVYAADSAAHMLAINYEGNLKEDTYVIYLHKIAEATLDRRQFAIVDLAANLAWRSGQPFRDMGDNPLGRIVRPVNSPWGALSQAERNKDRVQVQLGAQILLAVISKQATD